MAVRSFRFFVNPLTMEERPKLGVLIGIQLQASCENNPALQLFPLLLEFKVMWLWIGFSCCCFCWLGSRWLKMQLPDELLGPGPWGDSRSAKEAGLVSSSQQRTQLAVTVFWLHCWSLRCTPWHLLGHWPQCFIHSRGSRTPSTCVSRLPAEGGSLTKTSANQEGKISLTNSEPESG